MEGELEERHDHREHHRDRGEGDAPARQRPPDDLQSERRQRNERGDQQEVPPREHPEGGHERVQQTRGHRDPEQGAREREEEARDECRDQPGRREPAALADLRPSAPAVDEPDDRKGDRQPAEVVDDLGARSAVLVRAPERLEPVAEDDVPGRRDEQVGRANSEDP